MSVYCSAVGTSEAGRRRIGFKHGSGGTLDDRVVWGQGAT